MARWIAAGSSLSVEAPLDELAQRRELGEYLLLRRRCGLRLARTLAAELHFLDAKYFAS